MSISERSGPWNVFSIFVCSAGCCCCCLQSIHLDHLTVAAVACGCSFIWWTQQEPVSQPANRDEPYVVAMATSKSLLYSTHSQQPQLPSVYKCKAIGLRIGVSIFFHIYLHPKRSDKIKKKKKKKGGKKESTENISKECPVAWTW